MTPGGRDTDDTQPAQERADRVAVGAEDDAAASAALASPSYCWSPVEPPSEVREHYETEIVEADRLTVGAGRLELARTQEIIRRYLPPAPLTILDVGGG